MSFSAPARIDLTGGTLDIPPLCFIIEDSLTLNLAINLRSKVHIVREGSGLLLSNPTQKLSDMPLFSKTLERYGQTDRLDIRVESDIPKASGLGGSSSLLVALTCAMNPSFARLESLKDELLGEVTVLEHRLLGKPAGTQDAIAAIYGGLSQISFEKATPHRRPMRIPKFLDGALYLAYSSVQHHSGINNWGIIRDACEGDRKTTEILKNLNRTSHRMKTALENEDRSLFLECLQRESSLRSQLCDTVTTEDMNQFLKEFNSKITGKVCGAGGGGCMFLFGESMDEEELRHGAAKVGMTILEVVADREGCLEVEA